jgi:filamin
MQVLEKNKDAELTVSVKGLTTDPTLKVTGDVETGFLAEFTPNEIGPYLINVDYNNEPVDGTPFVGNTYDASQVVVSPISKGKVGKPLQFTVDLSNTGKFI